MTSLFSFRLKILIAACCGLMTILFTTSSLAYNNPTPSKNISVYFGFELPSFPPKDFGMISSQVDINVPLNLFSHELDHSGIHMGWYGASSFLRLYDVPKVEAISLHYKHEYWHDDAITLTPYAGGSLIINHAGQHTGLAVDAGLVAGYDPFSWLRVYSPVELQLFSDGLSCSIELGLRPLIPSWLIGLDIGVGWSMMSTYDFKKTAGNFKLFFGLGGGF